MSLTNEQLERYSRHIILRQVGGKGQEKILSGKVLIIGTGGLGAPAAMYLAAAGIGTIGLADSDVVDLSNLQRQIIHQTQDVGKAKVESGRETILSGICGRRRSADCLCAKIIRPRYVASILPFTWEPNLYYSLLEIFNFLQ